MLNIRLPFPSSKLSPNSRLHWAQRHRASKQAKGDACMLTMQAIQSSGIPEASLQHVLQLPQIDVRLFFHPSAKYRYDQDNLIARMKAALDGVSATLGVDDVKFNIAKAHIMPPCKSDPHVLVVVG
tara:strand:- start:1320 stop:1697 length:378 start_codon:yes stop_codon:yes gene_type:complete